MTETMQQEPSHVSEITPRRYEIRSESYDMSFTVEGSRKEMQQHVRDVAALAADDGIKAALNFAANVLRLPFCRVRALYYGEARRIDAHDILERASVVMDGNGKFRGVKIDVDENGINLTGGPAGSPIIDDHIDAIYSGPPVSVGFNARYLRDALASLGAEEAELHVRDADAPFRICARGSVDESVTLMPARV